MIRIKFTEETALLLVGLGFTSTSFPASWEDVGDCENGPKLEGHAGYDEWCNGKTSVYVVDGHIEEIEATNPGPDNIPF